MTISIILPLDFKSNNKHVPKVQNLRIQFKGFNKTVVKVTQKSFRQSAWCVETMDITKPYIPSL